MATTTDRPAQHFLSGRKIIVAGGGMAGLAFVTALKRLWDSSIEPPVIVLFERDLKDTSLQREGYSLLLNGNNRDSGLYALKKLGLLDATLDHAILRAEDQGAFTMWTHEFKPMLTLRPKPPSDLPTGGIRIARKDLRLVLVDAASEDVSVQWGKTCKSAKRTDDGRIRVQIVAEETGEETYEDCDLLVAADGAASKIRSCLRPNDDLQFAGAVQMGGNAKFENGIPPPLDINWGGVLTGCGVACFFSPVDQHTLVWALSIREQAPRPKYDNSDAEQVRKMLEEARELGKTITEPFSTIVNCTEPSSTIVINARDKQPFPHDLKTGPVIFLGDSNHAVSPFAGNGANLALQDGWDLAEQVCRATSLEKAAAAYDKLAIPRAVETIKTSHSRIHMGHVEGVRHWFYRCGMSFGGIMLTLLGKS